jgi:hypothetical protein
MVNDAKKYEIIKQILAVWDQRLSAYKDNKSDAAIAKILGLAEIDVRTVRWETVGDTQLEKDRRNLRYNNAKVVVREVTKNFNQIKRIVDELSEDARNYAEIWSEIAEVSDDLGATIRDMPNALQDLPTKSIQLEEDAYKNLSTLWAALEKFQPAIEAKQKLRTIGRAIGWEPSDSID